MLLTILKWILVLLNLIDQPNTAWIPKQRMLYEHFNLSNRDGLLITWAHAVNSKKYLTETLNSDIMFIEADVLMIDEKHSEPIMAHPPLTDSDLTFREFLESSLTSRKGLKLDFKTLNSVEPCLKMLSSNKDKIKAPVFLNADIFRGNSLTPEVKLAAHTFLSHCITHFPGSTALSLGWTTIKDPSVTYTWHNVYSVYQFLSKYDLSTEITFAVRGLWTIKSIYQLIALQKLIPHSTFTVWSSDPNLPDYMEELLLIRKLIEDKSTVYYDLGPIQDAYMMLNHHKVDENLSKSQSKLVEWYFKHKMFNPSDWIVSGQMVSSILIDKNAKIAYRKQIGGIVRVYSKFEMFLLSEEEPNAHDGICKLSLHEVDIIIHTSGLVEILSNDTLLARSENDLNTKSSVDNRLPFIFEYNIVIKGSLIDIEISSYVFSTRTGSAKLTVQNVPTFSKLELSLLSHGYGLGIDSLDVTFLN